MSKKKKNIVRRSIIKYIGCFVISALFIAITIVTSMYSTLISTVLDAPTTRIENRVEDIYTSDFDSYEDLVEYQESLGQRIVEEGAVLLKNTNGTLPFGSEIKNISLFGQNSVDPVYGGAGSGAVNTDKAITIQESFETAGYSVNPQLWEFYESGLGSEYRKELVSVTGAGKYAVNEVPRNVYTDDVISSFDNYKDAAVIFIGRSGGESTDLPVEAMDNGSYYLEINDDERDMIELATEHFDTVVVVVNSNNPIELNFVEEYPIDAVLWVAGLGQTGSNALGQLFNGNVNPSGRLVNTYARNSLSAPSAVNFGDYEISNSSVFQGDRYLVYAEGIYVGYRYYETRYEDVMLNQGNAGNYNYSNEVQYPFGFGLSYSSFEWSDYQVEEQQDQFKVDVTVTNTGDTAGKDVVQMYMQSPYTESNKLNGIEKASVELVGFTKTDLIEPGESATVTVLIDKEEMKTYDYKVAETYVLDAGNYYFTAAKDSHAAINNILITKDANLSETLVPSPLEENPGNSDFVYTHTVANTDPTTYGKSETTDHAITNQFDDVNINYYDETYQYLSRNNWLETWPTVYMNGQWEAPSMLLEDLEYYRGDQVINDNSAEMPLFSTINDEYGELQLADLIETDINDPKWDALVNQLSAKQMTRLVRLGGYSTIPISAIGLPPTAAKDGTAGFSDTLIPGRHGMAYPTPLQMAATWNTELLNEVGKAIGEDSLALNITGWYAPGINIHRSPYSGRNYEYYSEDPYLSGKLSAQVVSGAREKGVQTYIKHFALNDQETNRFGGAVFANEQAIREIYLRGFEGAVREGGANAVMASMNRLGARWSGAHKGLMTNVLRDEWGFEGLVITDQASVGAMLYQDHISGLYAGTNLWLNTNNTFWKLDDYLDNPTVMTHVRNASKDIIYSISQTNAMNGLSSESTLIEITPWWQTLVYVLDGIVWGGSLVVVCMTTIKIVRHKKQQKQEIV
ncbi:glycoside hydrolase family 3 protein [Haloplasma contractile]|uniref:Beta-glucosidase-related glycosidase Carbohydrate transport protein n=1 Tax=Haloplasma contractile SSD-17B TaxID=1033810 RepID=F7PU09_9MOLU|nr:glycoside hydrolase family 3 protein [Haloplasma contractile]ERJ12262.1 Beta-glucosidase-related glycosidase Carbohydrate transport protein [Haloplasma contractile SSD-17B]